MSRFLADPDPVLGAPWGTGVRSGVPLPTFDVDLDEPEEARVARLMAYGIRPNYDRDDEPGVADPDEDERIFAMLDAAQTVPVTPVWERLVGRWRAPV